MRFVGISGLGKAGESGEGGEWKPLLLVLLLVDDVDADAVVVEDAADVGVCEK